MILDSILKLVLVSHILSPLLTRIIFTWLDSAIASCACLATRGRRGSITVLEQIMLSSHQAAAGRRVVTSLQNVQHNLRHWNRFHNFNNKFSSVKSASTLRINGFHSTSHQPPNHHQLMEPQFPVSCTALCWWATAHSSWGGYPTKNAWAQSLHWKVR